MIIREAANIRKVNSPAFSVALVLSFYSTVIGCIASHQYVPIPDLAKRVEDPKKGRIYLIGPDGMGGELIWIDVWVREREIGSVCTHSYLCWEENPGDVTISSHYGSFGDRLTLLIKEGGVYYIRHMWGSRRGVTSFQGRSYNFTLMNEKEGNSLARRVSPPKLKKK